VKAARGREELQLFLDFGYELAEKGVDIEYVLTYGVPAIAKASGGFDGLRSGLELLKSMVISLSEKGIDARYTLEYSVPAIAEAAGNVEGLKPFLDFGYRLAERGIDPGYALVYCVPAVAEASGTIEELRQGLSDLESRITSLYENYLLRSKIKLCGPGSQSFGKIEVS